MLPPEQAVARQAGRQAEKQGVEGAGAAGWGWGGVGEWGGGGGW